jgi:hypothetical protein
VVILRKDLYTSLYSVLDMDSLELRVDECTIVSFLSGHILDLPKGDAAYSASVAKLRSTAETLSRSFSGTTYSDYASRAAASFAELAKSSSDFERATSDHEYGKAISMHYVALKKLAELYDEGIKLSEELGPKRDDFVSLVYGIGDTVFFVNNIEDTGCRMHDYLIEQLESCLPKDRGAVALALARTGTDKAVDVLIPMVEGREYGKFWGIPFTGECYGPKDRLKVLYALGESGNEKALKYLEHALAVRKVGWHHEDFFGAKSYASVNYPSARGALRRDLRGTVWRSRKDKRKFDVFFPEDAELVVNPPDGKEKIGSNAPQFDRSYACKTAERAVKKLRETLGVSAHG